MTRREHLLMILAEEALEVAHRATKALRFGVCEVENGQPKTNEERMTAEIVDLLVVADMLCQEGVPILPYGILRAVPGYGGEKRDKVERYLELSKRGGSLDGEWVACDEIRKKFLEALSGLEEREVYGLTSRPDYQIAYMKQDVLDAVNLATSTASTAPVKQQERARIRRELLAAIEQDTVYVVWDGDRSREVDNPYVHVTDLRDELDRIVPEEPPAAVSDSPAPDADPAPLVEDSGIPTPAVVERAAREKGEL